MNKQLQEQLKSFLKGVIFDYHNNNLNQSEVKQEVLDYIFEGKGGDNKFFENYIDFIDQNFIGKEEADEIKRYVRKGNPKCNWCGKEATKQTVKGESNLKSGGLAVNDDYYCDECYAKGLKMEEEAMYGN